MSPCRAGPNSRLAGSPMQPPSTSTSSSSSTRLPVATLHTWQRLGWVHSRKVAVASGRWALWADADELERLRQLRAYQRKWPEPRYPQALTTPKRRDMQPQRA